MKSDSQQLVSDTDSQKKLQFLYVLEKLRWQHHKDKKQITKNNPLWMVYREKKKMPITFQAHSMQVWQTAFFFPTMYLKKE